MEAIVACDPNGVIGKDGSIPWHYSLDLQIFKLLTYGGTVIMGRKTYDGLGKTLPGRLNFVLSTTKEGWDGPNLCWFNTINKAARMAAWYGRNTYIIGGATVYEESIRSRLVDCIIMTHIHTTFEGDVYFPKFSYKSKSTCVRTKEFDVVRYYGPILRTL